MTFIGASGRIAPADPLISQLAINPSCCCKVRLSSMCQFSAMRPSDVEVWIDGSIFYRYQHPAWFASPRRRGDHCFEIVRRVEYLRSRHEKRPAQQTSRLRSTHETVRGQGK